VLRGNKLEEKIHQQTIGNNFENSKSSISCSNTEINKDITKAQVAHFSYKLNDSFSHSQKDEAINETKIDQKLYSSLKLKEYLLEEAIKYIEKNCPLDSINRLKKQKEYLHLCKDLMLKGCPFDPSKIENELTPEILFGESDNDRAYSTIIRI